MNTKTLKAAKDEALRFIQKCRILEEKTKGDVFSFYGCKESGAVRRASMDLTRSLADLRSNRGLK